MISVALRQMKKEQKGKAYLFLDFYPPLFNPITRKTKRQEYLGLFIYLHPANDFQKAYNKRVLEQGEAIRCKRNLEVVNNEFGFKDSINGAGDFLEFYRKLAEEHDRTWILSYKRFVEFVNGKCTFKNITVDLCDEYKEWLQTKALNYNNGHLIDNNTAAKFFIIFRRILKEAYKFSCLPKDINRFLEYIPYDQKEREFLLYEEVLKLYKTPCRYEVLKRASMFSIFTGLRLSDIVTLDWKDIGVAPDGKPCIRKLIQKTQRNELIFISEEALSFCGKPQESGRVFRDLTKSMTIYPLRQWIKDAGITKHITFHCFRHTNATLMLCSGADMYTVSRQLTHADIKTTQIYTHLVDTKRREASELISLRD